MHTRWSQFVRNNYVSPTSEDIKLYIITSQPHLSLVSLDVLPGPVLFLFHDGELGGTAQDSCSKGLGFESRRQEL